ncbi:MAG: transglycosylase SLT domain-containing protein [Anaerolineae bacterium]|nr:transglycosylase SLT domain-containing protein [Anaerolineae bacterium]
MATLAAMLASPDGSEHVGKDLPAQAWLIERVATAIADVEFARAHEACLIPYRIPALPTTFVMAIALTEAYARPMWRQEAEFALARINVIVGGKLPDYSLGLAQVKPSAVRKIQGRSDEKGTANLTDSEILNQLSQPCGNLAAAYQYLDYLMAEAGREAFDRQTADDLLIQYNGQAEANLWPNALYREIVWQVYLRLREGI